MSDLSPIDAMKGVRTGKKIHRRKNPIRMNVYISVISDVTHKRKLVLQRWYLERNESVRLSVRLDYLYCFFVYVTSDVSGCFLNIA